MFSIIAGVFMMGVAAVLLYVYLGTIDRQCRTRVSAPRRDRANLKNWSGSQCDQRLHESLCHLLDESKSRG